MANFETPAIPTDLLVLPAEAFVKAAAARLEVELVGRDAKALSQSLIRGVNKSRVWEALVARQEDRAPEPSPILPTAFMRGDSDIIVEDLLVAHAPADNNAFIDYAYERVASRGPTSQERLEMDFDLRRGAMTRAEAIKLLTDVAIADGHKPVLGRFTEGGFIAATGERAESLVLVRRYGADYIVADRFLVQPLDVVEGGWLVAPGLLAAGPKRSLRPGVWRLTVDLLQDPEAVLDIEISANGGLEYTNRMRLCGPTLMVMEFIVRPEYLVTEILLRAVRGPDEAWVINPREVSVAWVGEA